MHFETGEKYFAIGFVGALAALLIAAVPSEATPTAIAVEASGSPEVFSSATSFANDEKQDPGMTVDAGTLFLPIYTKTLASDCVLKESSSTYAHGFDVKMSDITSFNKGRKRYNKTSDVDNTQECRSSTVIKELSNVKIKCD